MARLHSPVPRDIQLKVVFARKLAKFDEAKLLDLHAAGAAFNRHVEGHALCKGGFAGFHDLKKTAPDHEAPAVRP